MLKVTCVSQIISLALIALVAACAAAPITAPRFLPSADPTLNIVQLAESVKDLSTLVVAVVHANLTGALSGAIRMNINSAPRRPLSRC
jgi:hypothetical protein